jgi:aminotransferase
MTEKVGIATVPGSSFYRPGAADGKRYVRFAFCKKDETLAAAVERLRQGFPG